MHLPLTSPLGWSVSSSDSGPLPNLGVWGFCSISAVPSTTLSWSETSAVLPGTCWSPSWGSLGVTAPNPPITTGITLVFFLPHLFQLLFQLEVYAITSAAVKIQWGSLSKILKATCLPQNMSDTDMRVVPISQLLLPWLKMVAQLSL